MRGDPTHSLIHRAHRNGETLIAETSRQRECKLMYLEVKKRARQALKGPTASILCPRVIHSLGPEGLSQNPRKSGVTLVIGRTKSHLLEVQDGRLLKTLSFFSPLVSGCSDPVHE